MHKKNSVASNSVAERRVAHLPLRALSHSRALPPRSSASCCPEKCRTLHIHIAHPQMVAVDDFRNGEGSEVLRIRNHILHPQLTPSVRTRTNEDVLFPLALIAQSGVLLANMSMRREKFGHESPPLRRLGCLCAAPPSVSFALLSPQQGAARTPGMLACVALCLRYPSCCQTKMHQFPSRWHGLTRVVMETYEPRKSERRRHFETPFGGIQAGDACDNC
mmetsp:Transcript_53708/g.85473  ORF Transcript_53708/g.85473 Transcript_53708/m.85473 type:complete len:219 (+) Transcript_53708:36-692(+)